MAQGMIILVWLAVSAYAAVGLFRPIRPFGSRRNALYGLIGAFVVATGCNALISPKAPAKPEITQPVAQRASVAGPSEPDFIVHTDANGASAEPEHADARAVADARGVARAQLEYLTSLEGVVGTAIDRQEPTLAHRAADEAAKAGFGLTKAREPLVGKAEIEDAMHCERAAFELGQLARKIAEGKIDFDSFQDRKRLFASYGREKAGCEQWAKA